MIPVCLCPAGYTLDDGGNCRSPDYVETTRPTTPTTPMNVSTQGGVPDTTSKATLVCSKPCLNGGSCKRLFHTTICSCPRGFTGLQCEIPKEDKPAHGTDDGSATWVIAAVVVVLLIVTASLVLCYKKYTRNGRFAFPIKYKAVF